MTASRIQLSSAAAYIILSIFGIFFVLPFVWLLLASLDSAATLAVKLPDHLSLDNFTTILTNGMVAQPFRNSMILAVSTMLTTLVLAGLAAYPLSRYPFPGKKTLMYFILFATGLPILALVSPLYAMYVQLNLVNTFQGVILFLVAAALPFNIWLMKTFLDSVPIELEEAAWMDGCSVVGSFFRIVLPLSAPGVAVVGVLSFLSAWTNFFVPFILFTTEDNMPASVNIFGFFGAYGQVSFGQLAAYAMLYALPAVALYLGVSRFFVKGVNLGGVKG